MNPPTLTPQQFDALVNYVETAIACAAARSEGCSDKWLTPNLDTARRAAEVALCGEEVP